MAGLGPDIRRNGFRLVPGGGVPQPQAEGVHSVESKSAVRRLTLVKCGSLAESGVRPQLRRRDEVSLSRSLGAYHGLVATACGVWLTSGFAIFGAVLDNGGASAAGRAIWGIIGATAGTMFAALLFKRLAQGRIVGHDGVIKPEGISYGVGSAIGLAPAVTIPFLPLLCTEPSTVGLSMLASVAIVALARLNCRAREQLLAESSS